LADEACIFNVLLIFNQDTHM